MTAKQMAKTAALASAVVVFATLVVGLRMRNYVPFVGAIAVYLGVLLSLWPRTRVPKPLPDGVERPAYNLAIERLTEGAATLRVQAAAVGRARGGLFEDMAALLDKIVAHHKANPLHVNRTRSFVRNTLGRILDAVADFVALNARAEPDQAARLEEIAEGLAEFVPVLEKINQACIDDDLTALEINVEVLNDQLDRER